MNCESKVLSGVRVVDLTTYIAGPTCGKILADWGAEVIKVETIKGEPTRLLGGSLSMPIADDENPIYCLGNSNKKSIAIDMRKPESAGILDKLFKSADVFLTNFRQEALDAMGLNYEKISEKYPGIVFAHVLGYGENGPAKDKAGFDFTAYYARGGVMAGLAEKGGPPTTTAPGFGDYQLGMYLAGGICGALYRKTKTGKGDRVTVSLYHTALYAMSAVIAGTDYKPTYPVSRKEPAITICNSYQCKDGKWIMLGGANYIQYFPVLFKAVGLEQYLEDKEFNNIKGMVKNRRKMVEMLENVFIKKDRDEWEKILAEADMPNEKIQDFTDILKDEQAWDNNYLHKMEYANGNSSVLVNTPVKFDSLGVPEFKHAVKVGENTAEILKELGYSEEQINNMKEQKIIRK